MNKEEQARPQLGLGGGMAVIIACMIGTGVFVSLGYQVAGIQSVTAVLALWVVGGIIALSGALCYAELAVHYPGSGGEYNYLSRIYHPVLGFLSGWVSATVGFAAPIALSSMAFASYSQAFLGEIHPPLLASCLVLVTAAFNLMGLRISDAVQRGVTYLNIALMLALVGSALLFVDASHFSMSFGASDWGFIFSDSFAVSLIYVSFAYSGWNAVTYIAGDVKDAARTVPKALYGATALVMLLYTLVNFGFLYALPLEDIVALEDKEKVAGLAAQAIFGNAGEVLISALICLALFASVNSMTMTGPKVSETIGKDHKGLAWLAKRNAAQAPIVSISWQTTLALLMVWTGTFEAILLYIGFTLSLFTTLTVFGLLLVRWRMSKAAVGSSLDDTSKPSQAAAGSYKTPLFPLPALVFIALECWMLWFTFQNKTYESVAGLATISVGLLVYILAGRKN